MLQAQPQQRPPYATLAVFILTAICTAFEFTRHSVVPALERTPAALASHQWWRLITPLFVNPEGWRQIAVNFTALAILGTIVERRFGAARWLILYFASGLVGELAGYAWKPLGAGSSVAIAGLLGALAAILAWAAAPQGRVGTAMILGGALVLCYFRDMHGPPILIGFALAALMLRRANPPHRRHSMTQIV
jgi:rhomboid protease GluP